MQVLAGISEFLWMSVTKCLLLADRGDPCGMGVSVFCDASILFLCRDQFLGTSGRWSRAKSALWALGGGFPGASADSFW